MGEYTLRSILEDLKTTESFTEGISVDKQQLDDDFSVEAEKGKIGEETWAETVEETSEEEEPAENSPEEKNAEEESSYEPYQRDGTEKRRSKNTLSKILLGNPILTLILLAVLAAMCAAAAFVIPSAGTIMQDENIVAQRNAAGDINSGVGLITTNIVNEVQGMPKLFLLPVTDSPGSKYYPKNKSTYKDENGITHTVYEDPSISVDVWKVKKKLNDRSYVASYAKVKIAHPTQLRTSVSTTGYRNRSKPSAQAKKVNAVLAVNGDFYTLRESGVIIRQGTYYRKVKSSREALFIDSDGNFHFLSSSEAINSGFLDTTTIYNSFVFGPVLVRDGELCQYNNYPYDNLPSMNYGRNPRTGIGQIGELEYLVIVVDGRTYDSAGLTTSQFAKLFYDQGCVNAYNLDGGQSSCMVYLGSVYNTVSNAGERSISDIVYFASAMPDESEI